LKFRRCLLSLTLGIYRLIRAQSREIGKGIDGVFQRCCDKGYQEVLANVAIHTGVLPPGEECITYLVDFR